MPLADFTISIEYGVPRQVRVIVYDNVKGLRQAATRYDNVTRSRRKQQRSTFKDTVGICHRFEDRIFDDQSKEEKSSPLCAIVRLAKPHVGVGVVSHELAHAAVWLRELTNSVELLVCQNDEEFCWILGELVRQTINAMNEYGIFDD